MTIEDSPSRYARLSIGLMTFCLALGLAMPCLPAAAEEEPGTTGLGFAQLYSEAQPNKRGPLVVLRVLEGLPGAAAGLTRGDIVVAINGTPVAGRALAEIRRKEIAGPAGGALRLTVAKLDGSQSEVTLTRVPYPQHHNPASDPFAYVVPGYWTTDPRFPFPLQWAPTIPYHGAEDLAFAPNFDDTDSSEYHSYLFFWWIEGGNTFTAKQLESDMVVYFRGLAEERGKNYGFTPDLSQVAATYSADTQPSQSFGGVTAKSFSGVVSIYDTHGKVIKLNSEVVAAACPGTNHTAAFFGMSREPRHAGIWKQLDSIRDSFRCRR